MPEQALGETVTILLVEDNPGDARLFAEYLSETKLLEAKPDRAETLAAALDRLRNGSSRPDVVLLDLGLPDADGLEGVEAVVKTAPEIPVMVLTGQDDRELALAALRKGAQDYLHKDEATPNLLARSIRYALQRKRADLERAELSRFREVFEAAPAWIVVTRGEDHVFEMANSAFHDMVGEREVVGRSARAALPELEGEGYFELLDRVYETGETVEDEERPLRLQTEETTEQRYINFVFQPRREDGGVVGVIGHGVDVTEQVERRRKAEEQQRNLDRILETSADGILLTDADGEFTYANRAAEALLGVEDAEIVSHTYGDPEWGISGPDGGELPHEEVPVARVLESGEPVTAVECGVERPDGTRRVLSVNAAPLEGPDGELQGVVASLRDVTDRRKAERARARLTDILETTPDAVATADPEGTILWVNEPGREMVGVPEDEELVGRSLLSVHPERAREKLVDEAFPTAREEGVWRGETAFLAHDGREIPVSQIILAHRSSDGELQYLSMIARNISEAKAREAALEESEARFRQMAENIEEVFWLRDSDGEEVLYMSPAYEKIWGRSVEELKERPWSWVEAVHPEDRERVKRTAFAEAAPFEEEYRVIRPDGEVRWVHDQGVPVQKEDGDISRTAGAARDVTDRKRMEEELRHRALHDSLTELPNRTLFEDRVQHALQRSKRHGQLVGLLMLDLDRFKQVNDLYGHAVGDRLLQELAERLQSNLRGEDTAARLGGDEFGILLPDLERPENLPAVRTRLMQALGKPYRLGGELVEMDVSMGGVLHGDDDRALTVEKPDDLLRYADLALYRIKESGGPSFHLFHPEEVSKQQRTFAREQELRRAVREEEFELRWQPIVRLEDGAIQALEPLARWRHPEHGVLSPGSFIGLAEETGLIRDLGQLLFRQVCQEAADWSEGSGPSVRLTPNLSGRQFDGADLPSTLREIADEAGLEPSRFWVEITETEILRASEAVERLRDLGFGVFVDDFGTGHSSFHYLRDHRFEGLKIDMSFVHGLGQGKQSEALVETMITMGQTLDMRVVAEGIETEEQRDKLIELGCELGQGYLFARPMTAGELVEQFGEEIGAGAPDEDVLK